MIFDDWESRTDLIGLGSDIDWISKELLIRRSSPLTVGIFSGWGGGKSTFLTILHDSIKENAHFVRFNPWETSVEDDIRSALLSKVLDSISEDGANNGDARNKIKSFIQFLRVGSDAIGPILKFIPYADPVKDIAEKLLKGAADAIDISEDTAPRKSIRDQFQILIEEATKPVIIAIDDLDRVTPRHALVILEAIRHFLYVPHVAILLALDRKNIERMLALELGISGEEETVRHYLQKFIQLEYHIPPLNEAQAQIFVNLLLLSQTCPDGESFANVLDAVKVARRKDPVRFEWRDSDFVDRVDTTLQQTALAILKPFGHLGQLLAGPLQGNPRQLKRFLNTFAMSKSRAAASGLSLDDTILARVVALSLIAPAGWHERLLSSLDETGKCKFLEDLQRHRSSKNESTEGHLKNWLSSTTIKHWMTLEPPIEEIDLSTYLYVIRESPESQISLPTLLSENARKALQLLTSGADSDVQAGVSIFAILGDEEKNAVLSHVAMKARESGPSMKAQDSLVAIAFTSQIHTKMLLELLVTDEKLRSSISPGNVMRLKDIGNRYQPLSELAMKVNELFGQGNTTQSRAASVVRKHKGRADGNIK